MKKNLNRERFNEFWRSVIPYVRLQTKLNFTPTKVTSKKRKALRGILDVIVFLLFLLFVYVFVGAFTSQTQFVQAPSMCILHFLIVEIAILIASVSMQTRRLHKPTDLRIILTFPLNPFQRYIGEIIAIYIKLALITFVIYWPFLLVYGWAGKIITVGFVFSTLFAAILAPLVPFAISLVISVPFMYLSSFLQNKNIVKLILFIILFAGIITVYALMLTFMADFYIHAKNNKEVMEALANLFSELNKPGNFGAYFISELALGHNIGINFLIVLALTLGFGAAGIAITRPLYYRFTSSPNALEGDGKIQNIKSNTKNPYTALFVNELKQIIRTPAYAYFYIGVAFTMPILTYLISDLVIKLGQATIGTNVYFGFDLLILCIILSLIGSFSATVISREGKQLYITKMMPVSYRIQLLIKAAVNFTVSFIGLVLCIVILACTAMQSSKNTMGLTPVSLVMLFLISTTFLAGITFNGLNLNLARPKNEVINGQTSESNVVIQLIIGVLITSLISILAISMGALYGSKIIYGQLLLWAIVIIYAVVNILVFVFTADKKYTNIEVK